MTYKNVLAVAVLIWGFLGGGQFLRAEDRFYGVVKIENRTPLVLRYKYRFGGLAAHQDELKPGETSLISWKYDYANENASPRLVVEYDADLTSGIDMFEFSLSLNAAPRRATQFANEYYFKAEGSQLKLYHADPAARQSAHHESAQTIAPPDPIVGIGASLKESSGKIEVVQIVPKSSAAEGGRLQVGDVIEAVAQADGEFISATGKPLASVVQMIRGDAGTKVRLKVIPKGQSLAVEYEFTRARVVIEP